MPTIAPTFSAVPSSGGGVTIGDLNITHPVEVLDPQVLGQQLAFEASNAI
jgi:hypothetical protein